MRSLWIASEHHRLHTVEGWPDSPYKDATLLAIHSSLASLVQDPSLGTGFLVCEVCLNRHRIASVVTFPGHQQADDLAA